MLESGNIERPFPNRYGRGGAVGIPLPLTVAASGRSNAPMAFSLTSISDAPLRVINPDAGYRLAFFKLPGASLRLCRWIGPDGMPLGPFFYAKNELRARHWMACRNPDALTQSDSAAERG